MVPPDGDFPLAPALALSAALLGACQTPPAAPPAVVQVAAASDLSLAFAELGELFEQRTGQKVTFSFAASGALSKQLGQGAPFDVFAAANASFVDSAVEAGACDGATKTLYAHGHVVVWTRKGDVRVLSLTDLQKPEIKHIAIANPDAAPYGRAAREALVSVGLWPTLESKIVHAENVRQALQFAQTGNAEAALVALSLVARDDSGTRLLVESKLHGPIAQTLVVCKNGQNRAGGRAFAKLVASSEGQAVLERYGFGTSGEQASK
jgi:molybdate transport system substrate-binding protein